MDTKKGKKRGPGRPPAPKRVVFDPQPLPPDQRRKLSVETRAIGERHMRMLGYVEPSGVAALLRPDPEQATLREWRGKSERLDPFGEHLRREEYASAPAEARATYDAVSLEFEVLLRDLPTPAVYTDYFMTCFVPAWNAVFASARRCLRCGRVFSEPGDRRYCPKPYPCERVATRKKSREKALVLVNEDTRAKMVVKKLETHRCTSRATCPKEGLCSNARRILTDAEMKLIRKALKVPTGR